MSLDQTFLKIFGEEKDSAPREARRERPQASNVKGTDRKSEIFSFEEETRLRYPDAMESDEEDFTFFSQNDPENDSEHFTIVPEPSSHFREKLAKKRKETPQPSLFVNKKIREEEAPIISLSTYSEKKVTDRERESSDPESERTDAPQEVLPEDYPTHLPFPGAAWDGVSEISEPVEKMGSEDAMATILPFKAETPSINAAALLESAVPRFLTAWPKSFQKLRQKGAGEFALLADIVTDSIFQGNKILGFGGNGPGAGVTTLLMGIASEMTSRRFSVLVIDANFRHPGMEEFLNDRVTLGWENLIRYPETASESGLLRISLADSLSLRSEKEGKKGDGGAFHLLPLAPENVMSAVAASCKKIWLRTLLELSDLFDLVLIDHGSLLSENCDEKISELLRFGCDGYYLIADRRHPENEGGELTTRSEERHLPCLGIIENFT